MSAFSETGPIIFTILTGAMNAMQNDATERYHRELDARGLNCPLPILHTKKALNDMVSGQVLIVLATDPGSVRDFHAFSRQSGNELLEHFESDGEFRFLLRKK